MASLCHQDTIVDGICTIEDRAIFMKVKKENHKRLFQSQKDESWRIILIKGKKGSSWRIILIKGQKDHHIHDERESHHRYIRRRRGKWRTHLRHLRQLRRSSLFTPPPQPSPLLNVVVLSVLYTLNNRLASESVWVLVRVQWEFCKSSRPYTCVSSSCCTTQKIHPYSEDSSFWLSRYLI